MELENGRGRGSPGRLGLMQLPNRDRYTQKPRTRKAAGQGALPGCGGALESKMQPGRAVPGQRGDWKQAPVSWLLTTKPGALIPHSQASEPLEWQVADNNKNKRRHELLPSSKPGARQCLIPRKDSKAACVFPISQLQKQILLPISLSPFSSCN